MHAIAQIALGEAAARGIKANLFWSKDGSLATLAKLYQMASDWLKGEEIGIKCQVSLHSDAGNFSHVFGIYGRDDSKSLARFIATEVGKVFATDDIRVFSRLGDTDYSTYMFNTIIELPTVLIECGSHVNQSNREILVNPDGQKRIAEAVILGILELSYLLRGLGFPPFP